MLHANAGVARADLVQAGLMLAQDVADELEEAVRISKIKQNSFASGIRLRSEAVLVPANGGLILRVPDLAHCSAQGRFPVSRELPSRAASRSRR